MSSIEINLTMKNFSPDQFKSLTPQVIGSWIDRSRPRPVWKESVLARIKHNRGGQTTHRSILSNHGEVVQMIVDNLRKLCLAGIHLDVPRCRGIMIAHLHHACPEVFEKTAHDGSKFRCSESWVHNFLHNKLNWSMCVPTRAAQKLPANVDDVCHEQFLQLALTLRDGVIFHPSFLVNIDQTNVIYQATGDHTYEEKGSKQVSAVGEEEKRAFTLVVGISASGDLLPFQAIYGGKTSRSLPSRYATKREEAEALGFKLEFSGTDTYWSTFELMCKYVVRLQMQIWTYL
jgi:hypothetical protein